MSAVLPFVKLFLIISLLISTKDLKIQPQHSDTLKWMWKSNGYQKWPILSWWSALFWASFCLHCWLPQLIISFMIWAMNHSSYRIVQSEYSNWKFANHKLLQLNLLLSFHTKIAFRLANIIRIFIYSSCPGDFDIFHRNHSNTDRWLFGHIMLALCGIRQGHFNRFNRFEWEKECGNNIANKLQCRIKRAILQYHSKSFACKRVE